MGPTNRNPTIELIRPNRIKEEWKIVIVCVCGDENGSINDEHGKLLMETVNALRVGACGIGVVELIKGNGYI